MVHAPENSILNNEELSENSAERFDALAQDTIEVPGNEFIADVTMTREGQDLHLESPTGDSILVENYFMADPVPTIQSPDGSILSENLVESFLESSAEYAQNTSMIDESPVGAVEEVSGEATVIRVDGTSEPITLGTPIYQGDIIETSADGAVNVSFIDETSMAVSENARMAIDEYQFDPSTESGTTNLSVLRGVFVFTSGLIGRDDPDDVLIDTPVGSIGIRGTIIAGKIAPGGESEITVVEGAIVIKNGAMEKTLSQQFETVKILGFNDNIQDLGVKAANDVGKTYGSVSDVVPKLFSSINDAAKEDQQAQQQAEESKAEAEAEAQEEIIEEQQAEEALEIKEEVQEDIQEPVQDLQPNDFDKPLIDSKAELKEHLQDKELSDLEKAKLRRTIRELKENQNNPDDNSDRDEELPPPPPTGGNEDEPFTLTAVGPSKLSEGAQNGSVVAKFAAHNTNGGTVTYTFTSSGTTTSSDGNFELATVGNTVEVRLTTTGQGNVMYGGSNPVGHAFPSLTINALNTDGQTAVQSLTPTILDAAVHLGPNAGLDYHKQFIGTAPLPPHKIGDFDGDGDNDFAQLGGMGEVLIQDTPGGTPINISAGNGYQEISSVGDINNDGYADVIVGDSTLGGSAKVYAGTNSVMSSILTYSGSIGDELGASVTGLGDFDGDGISDFAIGSPGVDNGGVDNGRAQIRLDQGTTTININTSNAGAKLGEHVEGLGDINGDGLSDLLIGADGLVGGNHEAYVVYGGTSTHVYAESLGASGFKISTPQEILGGGAVGDINGDGIDDLAVSLRDGADVNTYIVYGIDGVMGDLSLSELENPDIALKIHHAGGYNGNDYDVFGLGDVNGDGFDDIRLGPQGGNHYVVHGEKGGTAAYAEDQSGTDANPTPGIVTATADYQSLLGGVEYNDSGYNNLRINGNGQDNQINLTKDTFKDIDGGAGRDTINIQSDLNFSAINFEQIQQIEHLNFDTSGKTLTLTAENIFNLLKSSDDGKLYIDVDSALAGGPSENLTIDDGGITGGSTSDVEAALNNHVTGASHLGTAVENGETYDHYQIGGYNLYIDQDINTQVV